MFVFFPVPWFMNGVGRLLDGAFASIAALSVNLSAAARLFIYCIVRCLRGPTANVRIVTRILFILQAGHVLGTWRM